MKSLNIQIAADSTEAEEFVKYLNELGYTATIGSTTGNFVEGYESGTEEANAECNLNDLWDSYCLGY